MIFVWYSVLCGFLLIGSPLALAATISQDAYIKASNTEASDYFGWSIAVSGDTLVVGAPYEDSFSTGVNNNQTDNTVADSGAVYVFVREGGVWSQQAYIKASNTGAGDRFGYTVAISDDTLVVSAPNEDSNAIGINGDQNNNSATDSGAVYVFVRSAGVWSQEAYIKASNTDSYDIFGAGGVSLDGDTLAVGASAEDSSASGIDGDQADNSSESAGAAYVFHRTGSAWIQQAYIKASNSNTSDSFGIDVAISGDTLAVGAHAEDSASTGVNGNQYDNSLDASGAVYVFVRSNGNWSQQAYIKASASNSLDWLGMSVALSGDMLVATANGEDDNLSDTPVVNSGATFVFRRISGIWSQQEYIKAMIPGEDDYLGGDGVAGGVSIDGNTLIVSTTLEDSSTTGIDGDALDNGAISSGAVYLFDYVENSWSQSHYLKAFNTEEEDRFGWSSAISGNLLASSAPYEDSGAVGIDGNQSDNSAPQSGAVYVYSLNDSSTANIFQDAYIKASNTNDSDEFGRSLAISGDTLVVGAPHEDSFSSGINNNQADNTVQHSGAAYVFTRNGVGWTQQAYVKASNTGAGDRFGYAVAISGDTIAVAAPQEDSSATGMGGNQFDDSAAESGAVYVYVRNGEIWSQQAYIKASNTEPGDGFGMSLAISGDTLIVGAYQEDGGHSGVNPDESDNSQIESGAVYVYSRVDGVWTQQAYLKASNPQSADYFGYEVGIDGDTLVVGAIGEDSGSAGVNANPSDNSALQSGAAYVFQRTGASWSQQAYLKASNPGADDYFGIDVSISGDTLGVGAYTEDSNAIGINNDQGNGLATDSGAAYVFVRDNGNWSQQAYVKASNTEEYDQFGGSLFLDGDLLGVSAVYEDSNATGVDGNQEDNSALSSGAVYLYERIGGEWMHKSYIKASNTESNDLMYTVAISGNILVAGAPYEGGGATGINGNQSDNSAPQSGAVYAYRLSAPPTAGFTVTPSSGGSPLAITLDYSTSLDSDGEITEYAWQVNGTPASVEVGSAPDTVTLTLTEVGSYEIQLTVTDDDGLSDSTTQTVEVLESYQVTPSAGSNGTIDPAIPVLVVAGGDAEFVLTPGAGYHVVEPVGGTCGGSLSGNTYTTAVITAACTVVASFARNEYAVTPSVIGGGTITPDTAQTTQHGATATFTLSANSGFHLTEPIGGTCGGSLNGTSYTTDPVTGPCTVIATFATDLYQVTPSATTGGTITPATAQAADYGERLAFTVIPDNANLYHLDRIDGSCGGTLNGTTFTTDPITASCTVEAVFALDTFRVLPLAGSNGSISPSTAQMIEFGKTATFTLQGDPGYQVDSVGGTCGGSLSGTQYTTNPIADDCSVTVSFAPAPDIEVQGNGIAITHGDANPSIQDGSDFGLISTAGGYVDHSFIVHNDGLIDLSLTNPGNRVLVGGSHTGDFSVISQPSETIEVGEINSFIVRFHPLGIGLRTATISIPNNDSDEHPYEFAIQGIGGHTLSVSLSGEGSGRVTGQGIDCLGDCSEVLTNGAEITLTATPLGESIFSGWSGNGCSGTETICTLTMDQARSVSATFTVPAINPKAILLAGGGLYPGNNIWPATKLLVNKAYSALRVQGFEQAQILYLSPETQVDLDNNGVYDDIVEATVENLHQAVTVWAADADSLVIYMMSHGGDHGFRVNSQEVLPIYTTIPDSTLFQWLDTVEQAGNLQMATVIIESCESGGFIPGLATSSGKRQVITSTSEDEDAFILSRGVNSFSSYFWNEVRDGADLYTAFDIARNAMLIRQTALLDADGNGVSNKFDLPLVADYCLGNCLLQAADAPEILGWSVDQVVTSSSQTLWASVLSTTPLTRVWASILRPELVTSGAVAELPEVELYFDSGSGRFTGQYDRFDLNGEYSIAFHAEDEDGNLSLPASSVFTQVGMEACTAGSLTIFGEDYVSSEPLTRCADEIIAMDSRVHSGADVTFLGTSISLQEGFTVNTAATFRATVSPRH